MPHKILADGPTPNGPLVSPSGDYEGSLGRFDSGQKSLLKSSASCATFIVATVHLLFDKSFLAALSFAECELGLRVRALTLVSSKNATVRRRCTCLNSATGAQN